MCPTRPTRNVWIRARRKPARTTPVSSWVVEWGNGKTLSASRRGVGSDLGWGREFGCIRSSIGRLVAASSSFYSVLNPVIASGATSSMPDESIGESDPLLTVRIKREITDDEEEGAVPLPRSEFDSMSMSAADEVDPNADPEEVDTALLVRKVKDRLHLHGISQRVSLIRPSGGLVPTSSSCYSSCSARQCWAFRPAAVRSCSCDRGDGPPCL